MNKAEYIEKLKENELYEFGVREGIIPLKFPVYYDYYNYFIVRLEVNKNKKNSITLSEMETASNFNVSEITIHRAIKDMS